MTFYSVLNRQGPVYTSLNTGKFPVITPPDRVFTPGMPVQFSEGKDITVIALGTAVHDVLEATENPGKSVSCAVFAVTSIRPFVVHLQTAELNTISIFCFTCAGRSI
jgi:transketolase